MHGPTCDGPKYHEHRSLRRSGGGGRDDSLALGVLFEAKGALLAGLWCDPTTRGTSILQKVRARGVEFSG